MKWVWPWVSRERLEQASDECMRESERALGYFDVLKVREGVIANLESEIANHKSSNAVLLELNAPVDEAQVDAAFTGAKDALWFKAVLRLVSERLVEKRDDLQRDEGEKGLRAIGACGALEELRRDLIRRAAKATVAAKE